MQQLTEGQINEPQREGTSSSEHETSLVETLPEEMPDELGHEWRVLHLFDLPGVRFPTNTTPANQRRLAENDALVELIQTTEYLDDVPTWGQWDYRLYPLIMVILFIEEEVEEGENGFRKGKWIDPMEDLPEEMDVLPLKDHNNKSLQIDEWSIPPNIERRDDAERCQIAQMSPPAAPPPTEERLFIDWSSEGSPRERTSQ